MKYAICSNMDGPRDCHTEWKKAERERQMTYDIIYMWGIKKMVQINFFTKHSVTDVENKRMVTKRKRG